MHDESRTDGPNPQEGCRLIPFPTPPGSDPLTRRLELIAEAHRLAAEVAEFQARLVKAGAKEDTVLAEKARDLLAAAGRLLP